jgi:CheY-like chemotaxis protein
MNAIGYGVSHHFNNLLQIILGHNELLHTGLPPDSPLLVHTKVISGNGLRAAALIQRLAALSTARARTPELVDLEALVDNSVELIRQLLPASIEIHTSVAASLGMVQGDPRELEEILLELAVNARDAMPNGGALTIRAVNLEPDSEATSTRDATGPQVLLSVTDTGCGIDSEAKEQLFVPFFTTKGPDMGTGLGLATLHSIVERMGGNVAVESQPGRGTTFSVYLPRSVQREPTAPAEKPSLAVAAAAPSQARATILVVDDEECVRDLYVRWLEREGYTVLGASDGVRALALSAEHPDPIDLLVTDVVMPKMSGPELHERLRTGRPGVPALFLSGYQPEEISRMGFGHILPQLVTKPLNPGTFTEKIREILARSS